jgi:hypothetical protein
MTGWCERLSGPEGEREPETDAKHNRTDSKEHVSVGSGSGSGSGRGSGGERGMGYGECRQNAIFAARGGRSSDGKSVGAVQRLEYGWRKGKLQGYYNPKSDKNCRCIHCIPVFVSERSPDEVEEAFDGAVALSH